LVHEAYLRLVDGEQAQSWDGRGHFFAAAAEAMRRILVEKSRRKRRLRHGGAPPRRPPGGRETALGSPPEARDLLALNEGPAPPEAATPRRAQLVKLRCFAGLTLPEVAELLGVAQSTAEADWTYAKAWLKREMGKS